MRSLSCGMAQNYPKISIITPNFNGEAYLEETIQSILNQNYPNLEFIIMDGGSTDSSIEIIKRYESDISLWKSEKDNGQADAINKGIRLSSGEWIAFLNSDDVYTLETFVRLNEAISQYPASKWFVGKTEIFGNSGEVFRTRELEFNEQSVVQDWVTYAATSPQPSTFLHRSVIDKVGLFNTDFHYSFDCEYWMRIHQHDIKPQSVPHVLARFRYHETSKTATSRIPFLNEHRKMLDQIQNDLTPSERKSIKMKLNSLESESIISRALDSEYPFGELIRAYKLSSDIIKSRMFWGALRRIF
ncbi:glycosyltransferase [bacterium]|nr:MAG: glycosyltransferase [bacterium]